MTNKKPKPKKMWAVYGVRGQPILISSTRKSVIYALRSERDYQFDWPELEDMGFTVEKVTVTKGWGK
jgi:hypothetical protein